MKKFVFLSTIVMSLTLIACVGSQMGSMGNVQGGEVTGVSGTAINEPAPYGMVFVQRGSIKVGDESNDSLWGNSTPVKTVSVDAFWMDEAEVSNAKYRQFVNNCFALCPRQVLHAKTLGFKHPRTGEMMHFDSEWAEDMLNLINKWRNYEPNTLGGR